MIAKTLQADAAANSAALTGWTCFGLALILVGQPVGWWVRGTFTTSESAAFPAAVVLFGLLLIILAGWDRPARLYVDPAVYALPVFLVLGPMMALALVAPTLMATEISYFLFLAALLLALALVPLKRLSGLPLAVVAVGTVSCALALLNLAMNPVAGVLVRLTVAGNDNTIVVGNIGATVIIASFCVAAGRSASRGAAFLLALCVVIALICVVLSNTKSAILGLVLGLSLAIAITRRDDGSEKAGSGKAGNRSTLPALSILLCLMTAAAIVILLSVIDFKSIQALGTDFIDRITGSIALFDSDKLAVPDQSSRERVTMLSEIWRKLTPGGLGISTLAREGGAFKLPGTYPHNSYIQVLYDLGTLPLAVYTIVIFVVPSVLMMQKVMSGPVSPLESFTIGFFVLKQIDLLTHSTPYDWLNLISMALVYVVFARPNYGIPAGPYSASPAHRYG